MTLPESRAILRAAALAVAGFAFAGVASWAGAQQPAAPASVVPAPQPAKRAGAKAPQKALDKPLWADLTAPQRIALEPLNTAGEWDKMDGVRKQKWLEIANRFASMKPDEQQRVHERMREWIKLTPDQRRVARENYTRSKKIDPGQKSAQWEQYQQLPDEQKKKLAAEAATRKQVANLPTAAQSKAKAKTVAPVKTGIPASCPAGTVKNPAAVSPACIPAPPASTPAAPPATPPLAAPNAK